MEQGGEQMSPYGRGEKKLFHPLKVCPTVTV